VGKSLTEEKSLLQLIAGQGKRYTTAFLIIKGGERGYKKRGRLYIRKGQKERLHYSSVVRHREWYTPPTLEAAEIPL